MVTPEQRSGEERAAAEVGMAYQAAGRAWAATHTGGMSMPDAQAVEDEAMLLRDLYAEKYGWHAGPMQAEPEEPELEARLMTVPSDWERETDDWSNAEINAAALPFEDPEPEVADLDWRWQADRGALEPEVGSG